MRLNILADTLVSRMKLALAAGLVAAVLSACGNAPELLPPSEQPLAPETIALLGKKGMTASSPIYVRIFKEESELEVWKMREDGRYYHFKTYPICNWSGELGPKLEQGDRQAPEGFYTISASQMNPNSKYYLAFNLGYPNAYDRALNRTGESLMIHGKCKSAGCYAMTDALAEEIYGLAREALRGGQASFDVHAFPFRMTQEKLDRFKKHKWYSFWATLKQGYDFFEVNRIPPPVSVCERRYVVGVVPVATQRLDPAGPCPRFQRAIYQPFAPQQAEWKLAQERVTVPGPKTRNPSEVAASTALSQDTYASAGVPSDTRTMPAGASALGYNP